VPQIAIRLSDDELAALDQLVAAGNFESRAAAVRDALTRALKAEEDRQIAEEYRRAYAEHPVTHEEIDLGYLGAYLLGKATEDEPAWADENEAPPPKPDIRWLNEIEVVAERLLDLVHTATAQHRQAS